MTTIDERRAELYDELFDVQERIAELVDGERINVLLGEIVESGCVTVNSVEVPDELVHASIQLAADGAKAMYSEGHEVAARIWEFEREWGISGEDY